MPENLTAFLNNVPAYLAITTAVAVALGTVGLALSKLGTVLIGTPWMPVRAVGHAVFFVGDLLTSVYSHWPDIAAALEKAASTLKSKGPGAGGAAALLLVVTLCLLPFATSCSGAPRLPLTPEERFPLELAAAKITCSQARASGRPLPAEMDLWCDRLLADNSGADGGTEGP
jgi:hypothetical protein